jgi:hypothetical protein
VRHPARRHPVRTTEEHRLGAGVLHKSPYRDLRILALRYLVALRHLTPKAEARRSRK